MKSPIRPVCSFVSVCLRGRVGRLVAVHYASVCKSVRADYAADGSLAFVEVKRRLGLRRARTMPTVRRRRTRTVRYIGMSRLIDRCRTPGFAR